MRILLLTDSLGCPRGEVNVSDTWTDILLQKWSGKKDVFFYTYCKYGLSVSHIDMNYIKFIAPDVIIMQVGIVDACRNVLKKEELALISRIPWVRNMVRKICSKYHYNLTKIRDIHSADIGKFNNILDDIEDLATRRLAIIEIAPLGDFMIKKTYNVEVDVQAYNEIIYSKVSSKKIDVLKPYSKYGVEKANEFILASDGHHLNEQGHILVFEEVDAYLKALVGQ